MPIFRYLWIHIKNAFVTPYTELRTMDRKPLKEETLMITPFPRYRIGEITDHIKFMGARR
jgi:hypothetical protein